MVHFVPLRNTFSFRDPETHFKRSVHSLIPIILGVVVILMACSSCRDIPSYAPSGPPPAVVSQSSSHSLQAPVLRVDTIGGDYTILHWSDSPGASRYRLQQDQSGDFSSHLDVYLGPDTVFSPTPSWLQVYRVRAESDSLTSSWSNVVNASP